jgi:hypothetical protein
MTRRVGRRIEQIGRGRGTGSPKIQWGVGGGERVRCRERERERERETDLAGVTEKLCGGHGDRRQWAARLGLGLLSGWYGMRRRRPRWKIGWGGGGGWGGDGKGRNEGGQAGRDVSQLYIYIYTLFA